MNSISGFQMYSKSFQYCKFKRPLFFNNCVWFQITDTRKKTQWVNNLEVLFCSHAGIFFFFKNKDILPLLVNLFVYVIRFKIQFGGSGHRTC